MRTSTEKHPKNRVEDDPSRAPNTQRRPSRSMPAASTHTFSNFRLTKDNSFPLQKGDNAQFRMREDATLVDALYYLFEADSEFAFLDGVIRGAADEIVAIGTLLSLDDQNAFLVTEMLLRLGKRLELCLALDQRMRQERDGADGSERASGEFLRAGVAS